MNLNSSVSSVTESSPGLFSGMPLRANSSMSFCERNGSGPVCLCVCAGAVLPVVFPSSAPPVTPVRGVVFGSLTSSLPPNFRGWGTAPGESGFSGMMRWETGGRGSGRCSGGSFLAASRGRFTMFTGILKGISGNEGFSRNNAAAIMSA